MGLLTGTAAVTLLTGCGAGHGSTANAAGTTTTATAAHQVQGRVGSLVLEDGYVPEAASPDVAAAYLTILNKGDTSARLTAVSSDIARTVMPMTETTSGGVGSMAPLKNVVVPAHGTFRFRPGAAHLMLEQPVPAPTTGTSLTLTMTFSPAGSVTVSLPVVPIGATGPTTG